MSRTITPEDLWNLARVGQPDPLPDGTAAVVPVTTSNDDGTDTRLWLVELDRTATPLTTGASATNPSVAPDGTRVAFLRKPAGTDHAQLHLIRIDGGESEPVTDLPLGVGASRWLPDGSGLVIAAPLLRGHGTIEATTEERDRRGEAPPEPIVTEDRVYRFWNKWLASGSSQHLFHLDLASGELRHLTPYLETVFGLDGPEGTYDISPDGSEVMISALVDLESDRYQFALYRLGIADDTIERLTDEPTAHERRPRYSPDGSRLLFGRQREWDFYADHDQLVVYDLTTGATATTADGWDRAAHGWEFVDDATIVLGAHDGPRARLFTLDLDGGAPQPLDVDHSAHGARPADGKLWFRVESLTTPPEVAELSAGVVSSFNDELLAELDLGRVEDVEFEGADGDRVQMFVVYPPGFDPSRRWPLVHNIHGGPHGTSGDEWHWRWNSQVFAAPGYVVASVNFHGSIGWGEEFTRSIRGGWGDKPTEDILAATDHLVAQGCLDPERMAIAGGSYGGYLVSWLIGATDRFACAVCHAGVNDLTGQWASDITAGREKAIGGVPWDDMDAVLRWSPLAHTADMTTPTLVVHGERDYRVVVTQGLALYGILKHKGVPARLVYYSDEGHWIERRLNSLHWHREFLAWLNRWLGA